MATEKLSGMSGDAPLWEPTGKVISIGDLSPARFFASNPPETKWIIPGFLAQGLVGFIYGEGGSYKSLAALWLTLQRACGHVDSLQKWLDTHPVPFGRSAFFSAEDVNHDLHHRVAGISQAMTRFDVPQDAYQQAIIENCMVCAREQWTKGGELFIVDEEGKPTGKHNHIVDLVNSFGADLIVLETYSRIANVDEIDNRTAARVVGCLEEIRDKTGATVLCIAHSSKASRQAKTDTHGQNGLRGAGALLDNARWGLWFRAAPEGQIEILNSKNFRTGRADPFNIEIDFPVFRAVEKTTPDVFEQVAAVIKDNPGITVSKIRKAVSASNAAINQALKDGRDEGLLESRRKDGYHYVG